MGLTSSSSGIVITKRAVVALNVGTVDGQAVHHSSSRAAPLSRAGLPVPGEPWPSELRALMAARRVILRVRVEVRRRAGGSLPGMPRAGGSRFPPLP